MLSVDEYKVNPCRISAIPYWKMKIFKKSDNILVVHDEDYNVDKSSQYVDTLYFRLKHTLENIKPPKLDNKFMFKNVDTKNIDDMKNVVYIINKCYADIQVDLNQVTQWTKSDVFDNNLWVFINDIKKHTPAALGIAELDKNVREGALEWIQVLPEYRNYKLGQALVMNLLINLHDKSDFVTVSGQVDNRTNPERLYRKCGFQGNDIWHVLVKK